MSAAAGLVTVLLRLPLFYNPDAGGHREPVENESFMRTAEEIAQRFGGGTLFLFRHDKFVRPVEQLIVSDEEVRRDP